MITAQDIQEKTFEKAFNGYNMGQVDEFLDEMAAEITAMAKENAALKGKMRVLVEKVEEYRQTEDSMRLALLSAQKLSAQIEGEAREKADAIMAEAQTASDRLTKAAREGIANEEAKLAEAKKVTEKFFEHMRTVCEKQILFYEKLSGMQLVGGEEAEETPVVSIRSAREKEVEDTVRSIETSVEQAAMSAPVEPITVDTELPEEEEEPTRLFGAEEQALKKKRSYDEFRFDDI